MTNSAVSIVSGSTFTMQRRPLDLSLSTGPSTFALPSTLLDHSALTQVCSVIHGIVHQFRESHGIDSSSPQESRNTIISKYPLAAAPPGQMRAIQELSSPEVYARLRHGDRIHSPYPALKPAELRECCDEVRAALVWRTSRQAA